MTPAAKPISQRSDIQRLRVLIRGAVQGVGFRPFVYRLAMKFGLAGWVSNSPQGVSIEVEGDRHQLRSFLLSIESEKPPRSFIQGMESSYLDATGFFGFQIRESVSNGTKTAIVLPDIATCSDCVREIFDPNDRRFLYPFTNCTNCGPRYSIIEALPYDRPNTTMKGFIMCARCRAEYEDPLDRRFHAQPNACPECGPRLNFWDADGNVVASGNNALLEAANAIRRGRIVAVKGLGGFHLMLDAASDGSVMELRRRKHREEKPLALMFPSLDAIEKFCDVSELEERSIISAERPIVILKTKGAHDLISPSIAPANPYLGCMLPYTPLHHLLMHELALPVVATSGNLSDEPICIDETEALTRLHGIADMFLVHDRPIVRHVDDSIVRVMAGRESVMRRARGFAPLPIPQGEKTDPVLAVGAHQKNAIALTAEKQSFVSQHIGDLETPEAFAAFRNVVDSLERLYGVSPTLIACDEHPDYLSTRFARDTNLPLFEVQHHYAHILSCMAENEIKPPVLGIAWDGTGFGNDGTIWGGEFLKIDAEGFTREAHLRTFPLPGGEKAVRQPRRAALGVLFEQFGDGVFSMAELEPVRSFDRAELAIIRKMLANGVNSPITSSVGRLFDAVASIIGLRHVVHFEGQAAMELEFELGALNTDESYRCDLVIEDGWPAVIDWGSAITEIVSDVRRGVSGALVSARFHNMLAEAIVRVAHHAGQGSVALSGGCFQNKYLLERAVTRLRAEGFRPYWHQRVPTNDGGIALGQAVAAARFLSAEKKQKLKTQRRSAYVPSCTRQVSEHRG